MTLSDMMVLNRLLCSALKESFGVGGTTLTRRIQFPVEQLRADIKTVVFITSDELSSTNRSPQLVSD